MEYNERITIRETIDSIVALGRMVVVEVAHFIAGGEES